MYERGAAAAHVGTEHKGERDEIMDEIIKKDRGVARF